MNTRLILTVVALLLLGVVPAAAQNTAPLPFALLDKRLTETKAGWDGSKEELAKLFHAERARLGERFEPELFKYLGRDVEKHYWLSLFLESPSYLQGNKPLPHLALLIKQQALYLLDGRKETEERGRSLALLVSAAVSAESLGLRPLAAIYKNQAESLLAEDAELRGWFPALGEAERELYASAGNKETETKSRNPAAVTVGEKSKRPVISAGVLNDRAVYKPEAVYPAGVMAENTEVRVTVRVVVNEEGRVESARAVSGPALLHRAAVEAAYKTWFPPTRLKGEPVRITGVLTYDFKPARSIPSVP